MEPCGQKTTITAIQWVLGIVIVVGGVGIGFSIDRATRAEEAAYEAKDDAAEIAVLSERISSVQKDVSRLGRMDEKLGEMQVVQSKSDG